MSQLEILKELAKKLKESLKDKMIDYSLVEGSGTEFGIPDKLTLTLESLESSKAKNCVIEISAKIGNSWIYSGLDSIRLFSIRSRFLNMSTRTGASMMGIRKMIETMGDLDKVADWVKDFYSDIYKGRTSFTDLKGSIKELKDITEKIFIGLKLPEILKTVNKKVEFIGTNYVYYLSDFDEEWTSKYFSVDLPSHQPNIQKALILQARKVNGKDSIEYWTIRTIQKDEEGEVISAVVDKEKTFDKEEIREWLKEYLKDFLNNSYESTRNSKFMKILKAIDK